MKVKLYKSPLKRKKYRAIFFENGEEVKHTDFGAKRESGEPYDDYTTHGDDERKERYLARHEPREDWDDPFSAGALSRWVLWNKKSLRKSWEDYKDRFDFE